MNELTNKLHKCVYIIIYIYTLLYRVQHTYASSYWTIEVFKNRISLFVLHMILP